MRVYAELGAQGVPEDSRVYWRPTLHVRYDGTDTTLPRQLHHALDNRGAHGVRDARTRRSSASSIRTSRWSIETVEVRGQDGRVAGRDETDRSLSGDKPQAAERRKLFCAGEWHDAAVYRREALKPGQKISGPALIIESHQTIVIEPGWGAGDHRQGPCAAVAHREEEAAGGDSAQRPTR